MNALTRVSLAFGLALLPHMVLADSPAPIKPKVMLITMFAPEAQTW
ncbi:MAG: purine nucleoside permease, partial [Pseudomonas sp.]|nr:purine nucleoside permease [Pseudomonas sp.]